MTNSRIIEIRAGGAAERGGGVRTGGRKEQDLVSGIRNKCALNPWTSCFTTGFSDNI